MTGYLCLINGKNRSNDVHINGLKVAEGLTDHMPTIEFDLVDKGGANPPDVLQEVVIIDSATSNPTQNLMLDPALAHSPLGSNLLFQPAPPNNSGGQWTYGQPPGGSISVGSPVSISVSNAVDDTYLRQWTQPNTVVAGQTYMLSCYVQVTSAMTNAAAFLEIKFLNISHILATTRQTWATTSGIQRLSIQAVAPANTTFIQVTIGVAPTSGTNSGTATFAVVQLEPVWFASLQNYPTPDCYSGQSGCYVLPNGTTVRQNRIFTGLTIDAEPTPNEPTREWHVGVRGVTWLLETKFANGVYIDILDSGIINSLISSQLSGIVTTNNVEDGAVIDQRSYDDITLSEVFTDLCNTSGFAFYIDPYYDLHYFSVGSVPAPYGLSDKYDNVTTFEIIDWDPAKDGTQIRNAVVVHGGPFTATTVDSFTANGSQKQFTLTQAKPKEVISVTVNGTEQTKGTNGDKNTTFALGYQVLVDFPSHFVLFQNNLANGTVVKVQYVYDSQIRAVEYDLQSYDKYKMFVWGKINDTNITTTDAAQQRALQELGQWAFAQLNPKFKTRVPFTPGQTVRITAASDNLSNAPFLIQKVTTVLKGNGVIEYELECGADLPSFTRLHKRLTKSHHRSKQLAGQNYSSIGLRASEVVATGIDKGCTGRF